MSGKLDRNEGAGRHGGADPQADRPQREGAVPQTTPENQEAAEGERVEKSPNPGHPV